MKDSIEMIWKEGFLNENSLIAPKINNLYNQKSRHLVDRMIRVFKKNLYAIIVMAILFPIVYYFIDFLWHGVAGSVMLLLTAWYNKHEMSGIKSLDQGATSLEYLKAFDKWLKDVIHRSGKIARISYPLYLLIALSTVWSAWNKKPGSTSKAYPAFSDLIGDISWQAIVITVASLLLITWLSDRLYKWEIRLIYGRVFDKLQETIAEMEKLREDDTGIDSYSIQNQLK